MSMQPKHHPGCNANYPEKCKGEAPQQITRMIIAVEDGYTETVYQCVDCGGFVLVEEYTDGSKVTVNADPA